jgi:hypothetical protein
LESFTPPDEYHARKAPRILRRTWGSAATAAGFSFGQVAATKRDAEISFDLIETDI